MNIIGVAHSVFMSLEVHETSVGPSGMECDVMTENNYFMLAWNKELTRMRCFNNEFIQNRKIAADFKHQTNFIQRISIRWSRCPMEGSNRSYSSLHLRCGCKVSHKREGWWSDWHCHRNQAVWKFCRSDRLCRRRKSLAAKIGRKRSQRRVSSCRRPLKFEVWKWFQEIYKVSAYPWDHQL